MLALVTGGNGFIGSHTVDLLLKRGHRVRVVDNLQRRVHLKSPDYWRGQDVEVLAADVADPAAWANLLRGVDVLFHLAAYQDYLPDYSQFLHVNTGSVALIFETLQRDPTAYNLHRIILASSQSVSGDGLYQCPNCTGVAIPDLTTQLQHSFPKDAGVLVSMRSTQQLARGDWEIHCPTCDEYAFPLLIDETTVNPGTAYGVSKYAAELIGRSLGRRHGVSFVSMRYTYVHGPRNAIHNPYSGLARRFALSLIGGTPITLFEDGRQQRDFVDVREVAAANLLAIDSTEDFATYCVGGGTVARVLDFAELIAAEMGRDLVLGPPGIYRLGDTRHTVSDVSALRSLGWEPTLTLAQTIHDFVGSLVEQEPDPARLSVADRELRREGILRSAHGSQ